MAKKRKLQNAPRTHPKHQKKVLGLNVAIAAPTTNHAVAVAAAKKKKGKQRQPPEKPTIPFESHERILLVGEGDVSFAASIVEHYGCANVTATVYEQDEAEVASKYPHAVTNMAIVRGELDKRPVDKMDDEVDESERRKSLDQTENREQVGVKAVEAADNDDGDNKDEEDEDEEIVDLDADEFEYPESDDDDADDDQNPNLSRPKNNNKPLFNIDVTKPPTSLTRGSPFDKIIFNFPHVGGKSTDVNRQVRYNQELLVSFFTRLALPALAPRGAVVVTLFEAEPYTLWNIRDLARHAGLQVERSFRFQASAYPGYSHARTLGVVRNRKGEVGGGWRGEERAARTYVFRRKDEIMPVKKKRRRGDDSDDDEDD